MEEHFRPSFHDPLPEARIGHHLITFVNGHHELVVVIDNL